MWWQIDAGGYLRKLRQILLRTQLEPHEAGCAACCHFLISKEDRSVVVSTSERFIGDQTGLQWIRLHYLRGSNRCRFGFRWRFCRCNLARCQNSGTGNSNEESIHKTVTPQKILLPPEWFQRVKE